MGTPAKLSTHNHSDFCEACQRKEKEKLQARSGTHEGRAPSATKIDPPEIYGKDEAQGATYLSGAQTEELQELKYEMVISLHAGRGPFWELVERTRKQWGIVPKVQMPPPFKVTDPARPLASPHPLYPEGQPDPDEDPEGHDEFCLRWRFDVLRTMEGVVPEKHRGWHTSRGWFHFLAPCVLYDPPDDGLREFVALGGPYPEMHHSTSHMPVNADDAEIVTRKPPVKTLRELRGSWDPARDTLVRWFDDFLRESGIAREVLAEWERGRPGLREKYREEFEEESNRYFIEYDEGMNQEDLKAAAGAIREAKGTNARGGRSKRDRLVEYQFAVMCDRQGWSIEKLAEFYGVSVDTAKNYVQGGRKHAEGP